MAFSWTNNFDTGSSISSEGANELKNKINSLNSSINRPIPTEPDLTWNQNAADDVLIIDDVYDEIQVNLDTLRSNNWCRGHEVDRCDTHNSSQLTADEGTKYKTYNNDRHYSQNHNRHDTVYGTRHSSYYDGYRSYRYDPKYISVPSTHYGGG